MIKPADEDRERIAAALRALRTDAGLTAAQLAQRLGWSQSKVSKTELGQTRPKPADVAAWAATTGAAPGLQDELVKLAVRAADQFTEWRRELAPGRRRVQEDIRRMEMAASVIRVFGMDVVPGLAQIRPYAEAMFRLGRPFGPVEEPREIVEARLARQHALVDKTRRFFLVMSEMAVRRRLVPNSEMRVQIERLAMLSTRSNITVGVIPFNADEKVHQYHGFAILGDPELDDESIVFAETVTRAINIRSPDEIAQYVEHFDALRSAALEGDGLRTFLQGVIADLSI